MLQCILDEIKLHALCQNNSVQKIVYDEFTKTLVRALPHGIVWVDEPSLFVAYVLTL